MAQRWKHKPPGSNWGEFGPDDQRGRMNYVTREKVLQGVAEVREGRTFCLSLPLDYPGGNKLNARRHAPRQHSVGRHQCRRLARRDLDDIGAELRELGQHEAMHALADAGEQDHRGDADGDAEQGQEAA